MPAATESDFLQGLFDRAREAMDAAGARGRCPPRFVVEGGRSMAKHLGLTDARLAEMLPAAALYQHFLPSVLAADPSNFKELQYRLPQSFAQIRDKLSDLQCHPQLVIMMFHMSGLPLIPALANVACIGGSWMVPRAWLQAGDWTRVRESAARARAIIDRVG